MRRPTPASFPAFLVACLLFGARLPSGQDPTGDRVRELAALARDLAGRGETRQALALVQAELAPDLAPADRGTLLFTLGWLEHRLADQDRDARTEHLETARSWYEQGLEAAPGDASALASLALIEGDLALDRGDRDAALAAWRRAIDLDPSSRAAGERFLALLGSDAEALALEARELEAAGHAELALEAWGRALLATPPEAQGEPALRWLLLAGELGRFTADSVEPFAVGPGGGGAALAELRLLARDPLRAPAPSWADSPLGAQAVGLGLGSLALERAAEGDHEEAAQLLERAVDVAPEPPLEGRTPARRALAIRLGEHLLAHPDLDARGTRLRAALSPLLATPPEALDADPEHGFAAHALLGRALVALGDRTESGPGSARFHLERAIALAEAQAEPDTHPAPDLSMLLAGIEVRAGAIAQALDLYLDAAEGFLGLGDRERAEEALREARALDLSLGGTPRLFDVEALLGHRREPPAGEPPPAPPLPERRMGDVDGLLPRIFGIGGARGRATTADAFAASSWYVGGAIGAARLDASGGDVEDELEDLSYAVAVDLDHRTTAWRVVGGYRFSLPLALEIGFADHGMIDSTVGPEPADLQQFLEDVSDTHPTTAAGPTAGLRALLIGNDYLALTGEIGVWYWEADVDVTTTTSKASIDRDGTDLFYGVGLAWYPVRWGALRVDYERFEHDDDATDVATVGLEVDVGALLGSR